MDMAGFAVYPGTYTVHKIAIDEDIGDDLNSSTTDD